MDNAAKRAREILAAGVFDEQVRADILAFRPAMVSASIAERASLTLATEMREACAKVEVVRDMDVPGGAWPWIEEIAKAADGPHVRLETPRDHEAIVLWHNERPAAFVLNLRDQFNHSIQYRVDLRSLPDSLPLPGEGVTSLHNPQRTPVDVEGLVEASRDAVATLAAVRASATGDDWDASWQHFHDLCGETIARVNQSLSALPAVGEG